MRGQQVADANNRGKCSVCPEQQQQAGWQGLARWANRAAPRPRPQGITWTHDAKGFFYCRFDEPETADKGTETTQNLGAGPPLRCVVNPVCWMQPHNGE